MVEEAVQHELETLRKLVLELTARGATDRSPPTIDSITFEQLSSEIRELKEYNATVRGLNTKNLETKFEERDKAIALAAAEALRRYGIIDDNLATLKSAQQSSDEVVDQRAQAANDALERRLDLSIKAVMDISTIRYDSSQLAVTEVRGAVLTASDAAQKALQSALLSAKSEVAAVDDKSVMRSEKLEQQIKSLKELLDLGNAMSKEAINKAESSQDRRLDSMNEFRGQMADMQGTLMSRLEADARFASLAEKLELLKSFSARGEGKSESYGQMITTGVAILAIVATVGLGLFVAASNHQNPTIVGLSATAPMTARQP